MIVYISKQYIIIESQRTGGSGGIGGVGGVGGEGHVGNFCSFGTLGDDLCALMRPHGGCLIFGAKNTL